jgi:DeoR family transcriptional regulator, aga operon transcriptional repressor
LPFDFVGVIFVSASNDREAPDEIVSDMNVISLNERRERMLALIRERQFIPVGELSDRFSISEVTVRSDLAALAEQGHIRRIRGGAIPFIDLGQELPYEESVTTYADEKRAIGRAAAGLVRSGESVVLDVGTTIVAAARALVAREELQDVAVFTNGLKTALELEPAIPRLNVVVSGGTLRPLQHSLVEPMATTILSEIVPSIAFLGCNGVHPEGGITNVNLPEAHVKRQVLRNARRTVVLADGSKIGRIELAQLCAVNEIDMVITGQSASPPVVEALRERGCEVVVAR